MAKILITGGTGFIGTELTKALKKNHEVVAVGRDIKNIKNPVSGVKYVECDIRNPVEVKKIVGGMDYVYHLAALLDESLHKNLLFDVNAEGTLNVLEACVRNGVQKVVYASSFYVYDGLPNNITVDEKSRSTIFNAEMFGVVKLMGERLIEEYNRKFGLNYVILRYGPVYGPHERCSCVIYEFIKEGLKGNPIVIWGRGKRKNQYTYVNDIVDGSVKALNISDETFNLISPERLSIREIAQLLHEKYGFKVTFDTEKPEGPSMPYISPEKAIKRLGWKPLTLKEGIDRTIKALQDLQPH